MHYPARSPNLPPPNMSPARMRYPSLADLLAAQAKGYRHGPLAIVLAEDAVELDSTLAHLSQIGFRDLIVLAPAAVEIQDQTGVHIATYDVHADAAMPAAVNAVIDRVPEAWIHYCYNAEYLFFPFSKTRRIRELLEFHAGERREAMMTYVIDLYAGDLTAAPNGVSLTDSWFDRSGYYALSRKDPLHNWEPMDRQVDVFGGLRRRFEEHVAYDRRRIDRISLFRAKPGLRLRADYTLSDPEMNTYACAWHHNATAAVCSFRAAKALRANPGSRHAIRSFLWRDSTRFDWASDQLMAMGFIEPGQWF